MEYLNKEEFLKDFAERTIMNLESNDVKFEVTQLLNSLMGLLVFPTENFFEEIKNINFDQSMQMEVTSCVIVPESHAMDFIEIIKKMRNAICHGHIEFIKSTTLDVNKKSEIEKICFINCFDNKTKKCGFESKNKKSKYVACSNCKKHNEKQHEFELRISVKDLNDFVKNFAKEISSYIDNKNLKKGTKR